MANPTLKQVWPSRYTYRDLTYSKAPDRVADSIVKAVNHHSACCGWIVVWSTLEQRLWSIENDHASRIWSPLNWFWNHITYHYMIDYVWNIIQVSPELETRWHAWDLAVNKTSIWICYFGNWSATEPSQAQYDAIAILYKELTERYGEITLEEHRNFRATECPWVLFDMNDVSSAYENLITQWWVKEEWFYKKIFIQEFWPDNRSIIKEKEEMIDKLFESSNESREHISELVYGILVWIYRSDTN